LIVDTIVSGQDKPGTIRLIPFGEFTPSYNLTTSHQVSLPTALKFGSEIGMSMPEQIDVLTVEAADVVTLSEEMTPSVSESLKPALERIRNWASSSSFSN